MVHSCTNKEVTDVKSCVRCDLSAMIKKVKRYETLICLQTMLKYSSLGAAKHAMGKCCKYLIV